MKSHPEMARRGAPRCPRRPFGALVFAATDLLGTLMTRGSPFNSKKTLTLTLIIHLANGLQHDNKNLACLDFDHDLVAGSHAVKTQVHTYAAWLRARQKSWGT